MIRILRIVYVTQDFLSNEQVVVKFVLRVNKRTVSGLF